MMTYFGMTRESILRVSAALAAVAAGFFAAWTGLGEATTATKSPQTTAPDAGLRSTAELESALAGAADGNDDPLERRVRFLGLLDRAHPLELRRLWLGHRTTSREKREVARRWAETGPQELYDFLKSFSRAEWKREESLYKDMAEILFQEWPKHDADAALAAAVSMSQSARHAVRWCLGAIFEADVAKGFAALAGMRSPALDSVTRSWFPSRVWKDDPGAFLQAASAAPAAVLKNRFVSGEMGEAFDEWVKQAPGAAAAWLKTLNREQQDHLWPEMAQQFAENNLAAATTWFQDLPPSPAREWAGAAIVDVWARENPQGALEWLQDNLHGGRIQAFASLADALIEKGPDSARQLFEAMPPGAERDAVVFQIGMRWIDSDTKAAMKWLLSLPPDDPGRSRVIQMFGDLLVSEDTEAAAAYVTENAGHADARRLAGDVAYEFGHRNPGAGLTWIAGLPPSVQSEAVMPFYRAVFHNNKTAELYAQVERLPSASRDAFIEGLAAQLPLSQDSDAKRDAAFLDSLRQMPESLRAAARRGLNRARPTETDRVKAIREALR